MIRSPVAPAFFPFFLAAIGCLCEWTFGFARSRRKCRAARELGAQFGEARAAVNDKLREKPPLRARSRRFRASPRRGPASSVPPAALARGRAGRCCELRRARKD